MPSDFRSGGWQNLSGDSWADVSNDDGYKDSIMDPMKAVCILPGRCQVNSTNVLLILQECRVSPQGKNAVYLFCIDYHFILVPHKLKLIPFVRYCQSVTYQLGYYCWPCDGFTGLMLFSVKGSLKLWVLVSIFSRDVRE